MAFLGLRLSPEALPFQEGVPRPRAAPHRSQAGQPLRFLPAGPGLFCLLQAVPLMQMNKLCSLSFSPLSFPSKPSLEGQPACQQSLLGTWGAPCLTAAPPSQRSPCTRVQARRPAAWERVEGTRGPERCPVVADERRGRQGGGKGVRLRNGCVCSRFPRRFRIRREPELRLPGGVRPVRGRPCGAPDCWWQTRAPGPAPQHTPQRHTPAIACDAAPRRPALMGVRPPRADPPGGGRV